MGKLLNKVVKDIRWSMKHKKALKLEEAGFDAFRLENWDEALEIWDKAIRSNALGFISVPTIFYGMCKAIMKKHDLPEESDALNDPSFRNNISNDTYAGMDQVRAVALKGLEISQEYQNWLRINEVDDHENECEGANRDVSAFRELITLYGPLIDSLPPERRSAISALSKKYRPKIISAGLHKSYLVYQLEETPEQRSQRLISEGVDGCMSKAAAILILTLGVISLLFYPLFG